MKLKFDREYGKHQPDPFMFEDGGRYYLYVTGHSGVEAYSAGSPFGKWHYEGVVCSIKDHVNYWAPCFIRENGKCYVYFSCSSESEFEEFLYVASAEGPLGPYSDAKLLYNRFSIDAHVVKTGAGLFLFYAEDNRAGDRIGTRIYVDKLTDPETPAGICREIVVPTFDNEIFMRNRFGDGKDWHTLEGAFWFREGKYQYLMYSGGCYQDDSYHIGYAVAESEEEDLTKVDFTKHTRNGQFDPVMIKNDFEEGVGHHSVIRYQGEYYAVYHGRDYKNGVTTDEKRTGRICKLTVKDGEITAERYPDHV